MENINVEKRDGSIEPINVEKIHKVINWAAEGLDVSVSQVEMKSHIQFFDGIKTKSIHEMIVKTAADLISEREPDYQYLAARLELFALRKEVFGRYEPDSLYDLVVKNTQKGKYDKHILEEYSKEDLDKIDSFIDHDRDLNTAHAGMQQLKKKYLVQNRVTGEIYETPQFIYALVGACLFSKYPKESRLSWVKRFYDASSLGKISLPTPIMAGIRTPTRQFSSCVLIEAGDSLNEINATNSAIVKYISQRAGIGVNFGMIRGLGANIRGGEAFHTGVIPFLKTFQASVKSCSQGGVRGGAATAFYPLWHIEVESLLVLKNNKGVEENRVRHLDYGVQFNKFLYGRLVKGGNITLFSPEDVKDMYEAFFSNQDKFAQLYEKYELDASIRKKVVKASDLFSLFAQERSSTGRIYLQNVDNTNEQGMFIPEVAPVKQSNLCVTGETEILTDKGYQEIGSLSGRKVNVWNGFEFSEVDVVKTGSNQKIITVKTSSTKDIECTPYHKFYVADGYTGNKIEKRAFQLESGDKLIKFDLPLIEGHKELTKAYENGFFSADGCFFKNKSIIYLYEEKIKLFDFFDDKKVVCRQPDQNRVSFRIDGLQPKFFVPDSSYTIESRLRWLSGYLDGDGTVARNGDNEAIQAKSINHDFLYSIQFMLQEMGIQSKVCHCADEGYKDLPLNDGSGLNGSFFCKEAKRILISSSSLYKLYLLGFKTNRLNWVPRQPQRSAEQFIKIESVVDNGRYDDTYCFSEPKRHMGMFNGVLTGQCLEIALPTKPLKHIHDEEGEIALCTLSAFNLGELNSLDDLDDLSEIIVRALDSLLDYQDYPVKAAEKNKKRRTLGVGVINKAYYLAKNGATYSDQKGKDLTHRTFEAIQFYLLKASMNLAKEQGRCELFHETKYSQGLLPIDTYRKSIDSITNEKLHLDWEWLRGEIAKHGLRNSTLTALMPSQTSSQVSNATSGIDQPRKLISVKASKDGILKQLVPEVKNLGHAYDLLWTNRSNKGRLELVGIMQKFVDQAISANTSYNPSHFDGDKVPMKLILNEILLAHKLGLKTLYYNNTYDGASDDQDDGGCDGGGCKI